MPTMEIVKAWKDEEYRDTLTAEQRSQLPAHPSGVIEFGQAQLEDESLFGPAAGKCKFVTKSTSQGKCYTNSPGHCK
jgi:mersacidin/lichenicidin family type 2 lantibiotic